MTRIAIMCQNMRIGGIQRLILDDAAEFIKRGVDVWLILFEPRNEEDTLLRGTHISSDRIIYIPYKRMRNVRTFVETVRTLRRVNPDIVFTHHWFANTVGRLAACVLGMRSIAFEHSVYDTVKPRRQFFLDWLLQNVSTRIIAVSSSVKESLIAHGIRESRIVVIENGINMLPYVRTKPQEAHVEFTFIFVGRLIKDKAINVFQEALAQVPSARALIVGTGPEEAALKEQSVQLGISDRVQFLGARSDIPDLLQSADALVLPSYREGFGLVVLEARAAGLPVIVSDFPAASSVVTDGVQGRIIPRGSVPALTEALYNLSHDTPLYRKMAEAAPKGLERFTIERHVDELLRLAEKS